MEEKKISVTKSWFLEKINKRGKPMARQTKEKRFKLLKSGIERKDIIIDNTLQKDNRGIL